MLYFSFVSPLLFIIVINACGDIVYALFMQLGKFFIMLSIFTVYFPYFLQNSSTKLVFVYKIHSLISTKFFFLRETLFGTFCA